MSRLEVDQRGSRGSQGVHATIEIDDLRCVLRVHRDEAYAASAIGATNSSRTRVKIEATLRLLDDDLSPIFGHHTTITIKPGREFSVPVGRMLPEIGERVAYWRIAIEGGGQFFEIPPQPMSTAWLQKEELSQQLVSRPWIPAVGQTGELGAR